MPSLTVENYLKATVQICTETGSRWASTGQLVAALDVSPGTVTSMLKTLSESGLAKYKPYEGVSLTKQGRSLALRILRRHRLIELFLVRTLELTWDQVHDEAERMEHAVSDELVDRIDEFLEHPEVDPHGDPIPSADGLLRAEAVSIPLVDVEAGKTVKITRVMNQQRDFLCYLAENSLQLGTIGTVEQNNEAAGIVSIKFGTATLTLGYSAAEKLYVEVAVGQAPA